MDEIKTPVEEEAWFPALYVFVRDLLQAGARTPFYNYNKANNDDTTSEIQYNSGRNSSDWTLCFHLWIELIRRQLITFSMRQRTLRGKHILIPDWFPAVKPPCPVELQLWFHHTRSDPFGNQRHRRQTAFSRLRSKSMKSVRIIPTKHRGYAGGRETISGLREEGGAGTRSALPLQAGSENSRQKKKNSPRWRLIYFNEFVRQKSFFLPH